MTRHVAFLRAINVGGRFVKMEALRQQFESLGLANVETYIQSGNVLFDLPAIQPDELERRIEAQLQAAFGFEVPAFIRSADELKEVVNYRPFPESDSQPDTVLYVCFLRHQPAAERQDELLSRDDPINEFHFHQRHLYWLRHRDRGESKLTNTKIEKILGIQATRRNATTLRKIAAKL